MCYENKKKQICNIIGFGGGGVTLAIGTVFVDQSLSYS